MITPTKLAETAGISIPFACQLLNGKRAPSLGVAFRIYDKTGLQFGLLANLTARDIEAQRKLAVKQKAA